MGSAEVSDFSIQSSILALIGANAVDSGSTSCLIEKFIKCSDNQRVIESLENPLSVDATRDLLSLLHRIGAGTSPTFKSHDLSETEAVYLQDFYRVSLLAICADLFLPMEQLTGTACGRCISHIIAIMLLFVSIVCGVRHLILLAKSRERSKALLDFISSQTRGRSILSPQRAAMVSAAQKAYQAEKAYSRIKLLFGLLEVVFFVGIVLCLVQPVLALFSVACMCGVVSHLTVIGLSIACTAAVFYLPLLLLESYAKRKVSGHLEKALCFYLLAKQTPISLAHLNITPDLLSFEEDENFVKKLLIKGPKGHAGSWEGWGAGSPPPSYSDLEN
ncbi:hypothetical protein [Chlamydiifrater phoenicopteri]|uniref:hypothetical protein n=1 Tax=Chlamydiifrater phoenicopteri TaxID=2681469 RepID=UPI001BCBD112|nr:hypothetical protein [Chlamydiifrater phoenicopteri]